MHRVGQTRACRSAREAGPARSCRECGTLIFFTLHIRVEKNVERLEAATRERVPSSMCGGRATIGPCIATHVGEGAIGVMSYPASLHGTMLRSEEMFLSL